MLRSMIDQKALGTLMRLIPIPLAADGALRSLCARASLESLAKWNPRTVLGHGAICILLMYPLLLERSTSTTLSGGVVDVMWPLAVSASLGSSGG